MMAHYDEEDRDEISTGEWIASTILSYIPLIGTIMLLIWAFGGRTSPTKANWAKAQLKAKLITQIIIFCLLIALLLIIWSALPYSA